MSSRRSLLASEEGGNAPGSPLRRSTRIANSPAPAAATVASAISRRRSSAAEMTVSSPAKITRTKRPSLSHEITLEEQPEAPLKSATSKISRAESRSPSAESESKEPATGTPARRGRKPSITKIKEEESAPKPETPSRRRSIRRQSTSPSLDTATETQVAKPRGRRASVTQGGLEAIKETEVKPEPKKVGRPPRSARLSLDATEEPDAKKPEKKPATRRSIRGRSNSTEIVEEVETKLVADLIPINEEEPEENEADAKKPVKVEENKIDLEKDEEESPEIVTERKTDAISDKTTGEIEISDQKADAEVEKVTGRDVVEIKDADDSTTSTPTSEKNQVDTLASPSRKSRKSMSSESDSVFKSPVRRSPRLSASPVAVSPEPKSSPCRSPLVDKDDKSSPVRKTTPASPIKSPLASPAKTDSVEVCDLPRRSPRLSESQDSNPTVTTKKPPSISEISINDDSQSDMSPAPTLSLRVSESEDKDQDIINIPDEKAEESVSINEDSSKKPSVDSPKPRRSTRLSESSNVLNDSLAKTKRKSNSFTESENKDKDKSSTSLRLSKSFGESNILNTENIESKTPSKDVNSVKTPKRDSLLKRTPEIINGSDGSFHLNLSIPTTNSIDLEDGEKNKSIVETVHDISGSSNNSDKENADKLNIAKSPKSKRISLSETSTPKLNNSVKMQSFCEPIEVEFSTDAIVASAQVTVKTPTVEVAEVLSGKVSTTTSQSESIIEVDNEDEFGSSPVKAMKPVKKNVTLDEEDMEEQLMNSFVDEVLVIEEDENESKTTDDKSSKKDSVEVTTEEENKTSENKNKSVDAEITESDVKDDVVVDLDSDSDAEQIIHSDEVTSDDVEEEKPAEVPLAMQGGSKRRKVMIEETISQKLDDLINAKLKEAAADSDEDEDYVPENEFVDDMASEGEEDTPSEDSNQIIDDGESLHSSESERFEDDEDDYENDSFITDDEGMELLSGNEYDLEELADVKKKKTEKKRKSRIIQVEDSSEEEETIMIGEAEKDLKPDTDDKVDESKQAESAAKVVVLSSITIPSPVTETENKSVVINEQDNLTSLESMKETLKVDVPREPKPSFSTPNNSVIESPNRKTRRKTSLTIQDQVNINRFSDGEITDKITKAVDFFVSSIKDKTGNVSVNVSLDYANSASSNDEGSPKKPKRVSLKREEVDNINTVVDEMLETTVPKNLGSQLEIEENSDLNTSTSKTQKQKKRRSNVVKDISIQDDFEVEDEPEAKNQSMSKKNKSKKRVSQGFNEVETNDLVAPSDAEKGNKKRLSKSFNTTQDIEPVQSPPKKAKLNKSLTDADVSIVQSKKSKKEKLNRSLTDVEVPEVKSKSKKEKRLSINKSLEDCEDVPEPVVKIPSPISKKLKKLQNKLLAKEPEESEFTDVPLKKTKFSKYRSEMLVEDEHDACASKSEISRPSTSKFSSKLGGVTKKLKKVKPSSIDNVDAWSVQKAVAERPSKKNKDKVPVVEQLNAIKKKLAPNDFRNQMIYGSGVKRMDSKDILKNKQKTSFAKRK